MRPQRGAYRSLFSVLFDDPDYQRLPHTTRCVLLTARLCKDAGPTAIYRYYPDTLAIQVGVSVATIQKALEQLAHARWIEFDASVLWVRNGLRYEPTFSLANPKHRASIAWRLQQLPKSNVVLSFCDYYHLSYPFDREAIPYANQDRSREGEKLRSGEERHGTSVVLSDDQFLATLRQNPAYQGINLDIELAKMDAWLLTPRGRRRKKTHQFIVNWLNNVDQTVGANGHSPFDARTQENLRAGQAVLDRLKDPGGSA